MVALRGRLFPRMQPPTYFEVGCSRGYVCVVHIRYKALRKVLGKVLLSTTDSIWFYLLHALLSQYHGLQYLT